jgi:4a-hydroxytetrahydrobiopterin dehydratase
MNSSSSSGSSTSSAPPAGPRPMPSRADELAAMHCTAQTIPLAAADRVRLAALVSDWTIEDDAMLVRSFTFATYPETLAFVNALGWIAHRQDHHPDLAVGYNRCRVAYSTHSAGGLTLNDFICAARIDRLDA